MECFHYISNINLDNYTISHLTSILTNTSYLNQSENLILNGNISSNHNITNNALLLCQNHYKHIFYIPGESSYYLKTKNDIKQYNNSSLNKVLQLKKQFQNHKNIHVLYNETYVHNGIKLLGLNFWQPPTHIDEWLQQPHNSFLKGKEPFFKTIHQWKNNDFILIESNKNVDILITNSPIFNINNKQFELLVQTNATHIISAKENEQFQRKIKKQLFYNNSFIPNNNKSQEFLQEFYVKPSN